MEGIRGGKGIEGREGKGRGGKGRKGRERKGGRGGAGREGKAMEGLASYLTVGKSTLYFLLAQLNTTALQLN